MAEACGNKPTYISDLAGRLRLIEDEAEKMKANPDTGTESRRLAYLVSYLAGVVRKHLSTGEC